MKNMKARLAAAEQIITKFDMKCGPLGDVCKKNYINALANSPAKLAKLAKSDIKSIIIDVRGIYQHFDYDRKKFTDGFVPLCGLEKM